MSATGIGVALFAFGVMAGIVGVLSAVYVVALICQHFPKPKPNKPPLARIIPEEEIWRNNPTKEDKEVK